VGEDVLLDLGEPVELAELTLVAQQAVDQGGVDDGLARADPLERVPQRLGVVDVVFQQVAAAVRAVRE
jgi:hypothetical protein